MKIRELKREPYFTIEFDRSIPFTEDNESHEGIFTIKELEVLIDLARSVVEDHHRNKNGDHPGDSDKVHLENCCNPNCTWIDDDLLVFPSDDPTNVDTDPPDEYNVYDDKDGHSCNTTVDGG